MVIKDVTVGQVDLSGSMTKQETKKHPLNATNTHLANMGRMLEEMELRIRESCQCLLVVV